MKEKVFGRWPLELLRVSHAPRRAVCGNRGFFWTTQGGVSALSNGNFTHRVAFEEVSGHRVARGAYREPAARERGPQGWSEAAQDVTRRTR